jgi:hypothetical protein
LQTVNGTGADNHANKREGSLYRTGDSQGLQGGFGKQAGNGGSDEQ